MREVLKRAESDSAAAANLRNSLERRDKAGGAYVCPFTSNARSLQ